MNPRETCFIFEIPEGQQRRQLDVNEEAIAFFSPTIYKHKYEYRFGLERFSLNVEK